MLMKWYVILQKITPNEPVWSELPIGDGKWRRIADSVIIFNPYSKFIIHERLQIVNVAYAASDSFEYD